MLTAKQEAFVGDFRHIATQAAREAGYRWPGKQGPRLMTFPEVAAAIEAGLKERYGVDVF